MRTVVLASALCLATSLTACSKKDGGTGPSATLTAITIIGVNSVDTDTTSDFKATASMSDGSSKDVTGSVTWASANTAVATIASSGRLTAKAPGTSVVSATLDGTTGQVTVTVVAVDNIQRVLIQVLNIDVLGTCEADSIFEDDVDGEFYFSFDIVPSGGSSMQILGRDVTLTAGRHQYSSSIAVNRNVTNGESFRLSFTATEYDGILGADSKLDHKTSSLTFIYSNGKWRDERSITVGSGSCGATLNFAINSTKLSTL